MSDSGEVSIRDRWQGQFHTQVVGRKRWRFVSPLLYNRNNVFSPVDLERPDLHR
jgi:hypothetical protein